MKNKKLISAILAAASIAGGVVGAQAADTSTLEAKVDSYTSRVMQAETKIQDLKTKVDALDTTGIANNKAGIEANKNAIATQGTQISQIQKDMAQDAMDRAAEMDKLTTKVNQKADKADVEANKNNIASNAAAIKTETQKRENAVNGLQNQVTVASGRIDNLKNQVTANKGDIAVLQQQIKDSGQAFNAEQVNKIDANEKRSENNKNDITTIFGQLNQGAYNTQDGYAIKKDDTIGGALKNLDKNAEAEATARKDADTKLNAKIDSNAAKVQEQLDAQDNKNKAQDVSIKANGAAIKANKDAITANADAIKANKAEADATNTYFNGRIENNTANIDKNKVAIENEATARKDADTKLQTQIDTNKQQISQNQQNIGKNSSAIKTLQDNWKDSNRAFNAEQVQKIDSNEANINLIHRRVDDQQKQIDKNGIKADTALKVAGNGVMYNHANNLTDGVNENTKKIDAETNARVDADKKLNAKIDSNAVKVQEQLDAQDNKNKAQDESIEANGAAIKANKDAIKTNADAIKANKAEADATNTYFNGRIENNTANIDKNKVAIENEATARKDADQKLQNNINAEATARKDADTKLQKQIDKNGIKADTALKVAGNGVLYNHATNLTDGVNLNTKGVNENAKKIDAEATARKDADTKLQANIDKEIADRIAGDNALNSRIDQVESDANKGIAKASALAALHPLDYDPDNKFDIAAAGGFYKGENAFALGAFYRPNRNVMLSMGTTLTGGDNAYNVGLTFKIGKSGKHMEAGLTTADLYAMIGAMQDKMDQQQKKIEELEAKQAK